MSCVWMGNAFQGEGAETHLPDSENVFGKERWALSSLHCQTRPSWFLRTDASAQPGLQHRDPVRPVARVFQFLILRNRTSHHEKWWKYVTYSKAFLHASKQNSAAWGFVFRSSMPMTYPICLASDKCLHSRWGLKNLTRFHHFFLSFRPPRNSLLSSGSVSILRSTHLFFSLCRIWYEEIFCITKVA